MSHDPEAEHNTDPDLARQQSTSSLKSGSGGDRPRKRAQVILPSTDGESAATAAAGGAAMAGSGAASSSSSPPDAAAGGGAAGDETPPSSIAQVLPRRSSLRTQPTDDDDEEDVNEQQQPQQQQHEGQDSDSQEEQPEGVYVLGRIRPYSAPDGDVCSRCPSRSKTPQTQPLHAVVHERVPTPATSFVEKMVTPRPRVPRLDLLSSDADWSTFRHAHVDDEALTPHGLVQRVATPVSTRATSEHGLDDEEMLRLLEDSSDMDDDEEDERVRHRAAEDDGDDDELVATTIPSAASSLMRGGGGSTSSGGGRRVRLPSITTSDAGTNDSGSAVQNARSSHSQRRVEDYRRRVIANANRQAAIEEEELVDTNSNFTAAATPSGVVRPSFEQPHADSSLAGSGAIAQQQQRNITFRTVDFELEEDDDDNNNNSDSDDEDEEETAAYRNNTVSSWTRQQQQQRQRRLRQKEQQQQQQQQQHGAHRSDTSANSKSNHSSSSRQHAHRHSGGRIESLTMRQSELEMAAATAVARERELIAAEAFALHERRLQREREEYDAACRTPSGWLWSLFAGRDVDRDLAPTEQLAVASTLFSFALSCAVLLKK